MKANKKLIICGIFMMVLMLGTVININFTKMDKNLLAKLTIDNIDALADPEGGPNIPCNSVCYDCENWKCRIMYNGKFHKDCDGMRAY